MNNESKDTLTIAITGVLTIGRGELEQLMRQSSVPVPAPAPAPPQEQKVDRLPKEGKLPRLAFSVKETAEIASGGENETQNRRIGMDWVFWLAA